MVIHSETQTRRIPAWLVLAALALAVFQRDRLAPLFDGPAIQTWFTIFVSIALQAMPFLVLGVVLSGAIAAFVPPTTIARVLPRNPALAVPVAGLAGVALPGCECGSVPIAGRLVARGAPTAAALTFLLSAPAINPVVIVATAVAFPGRPEVALARFLASLVTSVVVGLDLDSAGPRRVGRESPTPHSRRRRSSSDADLDGDP